jgi:aminopeptidase N
VSDDLTQLRGAVVDDIAVPGRIGSTSFEDDGNTRDGWRSLPAPRGSPPNPNSWTVGTVADLPPSFGEIAQGSLRRQPEIIRFLSETFGDYPFTAAGGIVDDAEIFFALENQTRPIYSKYFFGDPVEGDIVVVHELAHQWYGDSVAVERWQDIWLNEGFATYAEWLWSEEDGRESAQELFDSWYGDIPPKDPFWKLRIGDPGPDALFDFAVYLRGAMTLHQVRLAVGDAAFFTILRRWADEFAGGNVTTALFVRLAEDVSGEDLTPLFRRWLFTSGKPAA